MYTITVEALKGRVSELQETAAALPPSGSSAVPPPPPPPPPPPLPPGQLTVCVCVYTVHSYVHVFQ